MMKTQKSLLSSGEVADLFALEAQTLRNWCADFSEFLEVGARPGSGSHRRFSEQDIEVIALVKQMRDEGMKLDEIFAALKNNKRGTAPSTSEIVLRDNPDVALALMRGRIVQMQDELTRLLDENEKLKGADERAKLLEGQLEKAQEKIDRLNREIGRLESKG